MRAIRVALSLMLAGCGPSPTLVRVVAQEGYVLSFPASPETATGRDGPVRYRIDAIRAFDARFESAWFLFSALDASERADLLMRVERGLMTPGAHIESRVQARADNIDRVDLIIDHADGRRGYHRIYYPSATTMLQVSVVGPKGEDWEQYVTPFFDSLKLRFEGSFAEPPISASM